MNEQLEMRPAVETCGSVTRFNIDVDGPITEPVVVNVRQAIETEPANGFRQYKAGQRYKVTIEPVGE